MTLHWHHGYGGWKITAGLIDNSRTRGMYLADILSGHVHRRNSDENVVMHTDALGITQKDFNCF
jgi:hypothetical protein